MRDAAVGFQLLIRAGPDRAVEPPPPTRSVLMTLFAVSFGGQDQPFDCEVVKDALILRIRQVLRPREAHSSLGSKLLRLRRKLEHLGAPSAVDSAVRPSSISSQFSIRVLSIANDPPKLFFSPLRGHSPAGPISRAKQCSRSWVCAAGTLSARHALTAARTAKLVRPPPMTDESTPKLTQAIPGRSFSHKI
jgi:hypothetical protein